MNSAPSEAPVYIGIDWADDHNDYCLLDPGSEQFVHGVFAQTPEALAQWIGELRKQFGPCELIICLEQSRGPLIHALMSHQGLLLYPINPKTLARYREAFTPSRAKDDPTDAAFLCELVAMHRDRLKPWQPDDQHTRKLAGLCEKRRGLVDLRTGLIQQITAALKSYYPQALSFSGSGLNTLMAADFLLNWPTLEALQCARPHTLRKFYYAHNSRSSTRIEQRIDQISSACPLTTDSAIIEPLALSVHSLARLLKQLYIAIQEYDRNIRALFRSHSDLTLFDNLPGAGDHLAPRLLVAFGSDRTRYQHASELQAYAGIAPVLERSGKKTWVHWRWQRPIFLSQTFYEFAQKSVEYSAWAGAYHRYQRANGKSQHAIIRALAFKWIRVLFRCWQEHQPYDELRYLAVLKKHNSPLLAYLEPNKTTSEAA